MTTLRTRASAQLVIIAAGAVCVAVVACGRDLVSPDRTEAVAIDSVPAVLALVASNRNVCSIVIWDRGMSGSTSFVRINERIPDAESGPDSNSATGLGHFRHAAWSGSSHDRLVDAVCVIPLTHEAGRQAAAFLRTWRPPSDAQLRQATAIAGLHLSWGGDVVLCDYYPDDGHAECEGGVYCVDAETRRTPSTTSGLWPLLGPGRSPTGRKFDFTCDNDCYITGFSAYSCPGGGGSTDFGGGGGGGGSVTLNCASTSVQRLNSVSCSVSSTLDSISGYGFNFAGDDAAIWVQRGSGDVSAYWSGTMVAPGTVTAYAYRGSDSVASNGVHISVTARSGWDNLHPGHSVTNDGTNDLPIRPASDSGLGYTDFSQLDVSGKYSTVSGGPNNGVAYMTDMHTQVYHVSVNYAALTSGSDFVGIQTGTDGYCSQSYTANNYKTHVEQHEGTSQESDSHVGWFKTKINSLSVGALVESMHGAGGTITSAMLFSQLSSLQQQAFTYSKGWDSQATSPCALHYF